MTHQRTSLRDFKSKEQKSRTKTSSETYSEGSWGEIESKSEGNAELLTYDKKDAESEIEFQLSYLKEFYNYQRLTNPRF
jgi:hypothetical protein